MLPLIQASNLNPMSDISTIVDLFLASQDIRESSKQGYKRGINAFIAYLRRAGQPLTQMPTQDHIVQWKAFMSDIEGLSINTQSTYLIAIRRLFSFMATRGIYPDIAKDIKVGKKQKGFRKEALSIIQVKTLLSSIDRLTLSGKRDYALINLMVRTGIREIEAVRADVSDIRSLDSETVLYVHGKGRDSKDEFVVLTESVLQPIKEYLEMKKSENTMSIFTGESNNHAGERLTTRSISRIIKNRLRAIGIDSSRITGHSLRHSAITLALKGGATLHEAKNLARHENINTTLIYAHNLDRLTNAPEKKIDELLKS